LLDRLHLLPPPIAHYRGYARANIVPYLAYGMTSHANN
jgi:hypothetical protein